MSFTRAIRIGDSRTDQDLVFAAKWARELGANAHLEREPGKELHLYIFIGNEKVEITTGMFIVQSPGGNIEILTPLAFTERYEIY